MKKLKPFVLVVLVVALLFVAGKIIGGNMNQPATQSPPTTLPTSPPEASPTPTVPSSSATSRPPGNDGKPEGQRAALTAVTAVGLLSTASFLREDQARQFIDELVAPESQALVADSIQETGPILADYMGYNSADEAALLSKFAERAVMYRVAEVNSQQAKIWLLVETSWVQADGQNFRMPSVNLVTLQRVDNEWRYVSMEASPVGSQPEAQTGLSWDQTMVQYAPYLEGFDDVSNIVLGGSN